MKHLLTLAILLMTVSIHAQDRTATTLFLTGVMTDDVTTWRNMQAGHHEIDPLYAFTKDNSKGVLASLIITDVVTLWIARHYTPTHPKLVKAVLFTLGGVRIGQGVRNATIWADDLRPQIFHNLSR
jgi:hypothetical protein